MENNVSRSLDEMALWGRSTRSYCAMFNLDNEGLPGSVIDCGAGPSDFTAGARKQGVRAVGVDPVYRFSADRMQRRIDSTAPIVRTYLQDNLDRFHWEGHPTPRELVREQRAGMDRFLEHYSGAERGRCYPSASVLRLPFGGRSFELALSSHFLFLYDHLLSAQFHLRAIEEALRVSATVRIYPLLNMEGNPSRRLKRVPRLLRQRGFECRRIAVSYQCQKGGEEMLEVQ